MANGMPAISAAVRLCLSCAGGCAPCRDACSRSQRSTRVRRRTYRPGVGSPITNCCATSATRAAFGFVRGWNGIELKESQNAYEQGEDNARQVRREFELRQERYRQGDCRFRRRERRGRLRQERDGVPVDRRYALVAKGLCRRHTRGGLRPTQGFDEEFRRGRRPDLRVLALDRKSTRL